jgi:hypothetical protein
LQARDSQLTPQPSTRSSSRLSAPSTTSSSSRSRTPRSSASGPVSRRSTVTASPARSSAARALSSPTTVPRPPASRSSSTTSRPAKHAVLDHGLLMYDVSVFSHSLPLLMNLGLPLRIHECRQLPWNRTFLERGPPVSDPSASCLVRKANTTVPFSAVISVVFGTHMRTLVA